VPLILGAIAFYGVVPGVVAGVIAACVMFALLYGRVSCVVWSSMAVRAHRMSSAVSRQPDGFTN
jgi:hypothetical protein